MWELFNTKNGARTKDSRLQNSKSWCCWSHRGLCCAGNMLAKLCLVQALVGIALTGDAETRLLPLLLDRWWCLVAVVVAVVVPMLVFLFTCCKKKSWCCDKWSRSGAARSRWPHICTRQVTSDQAVPLAKKWSSRRSQTAEAIRMDCMLLTHKQRNSQVACFLTGNFAGVASIRRRGFGKKALRPTKSCLPDLGIAEN